MRFSTTIALISAPLALTLPLAQVRDPPATLPGLIGELLPPLPSVPGITGQPVLPGLLGSAPVAVPAIDPLGPRRDTAVVNSPPANPQVDTTNRAAAGEAADQPFTAPTLLPTNGVASLNTMLHGAAAFSPNFLTGNFGGVARNMAEMVIGAASYPFTWFVVGAPQ